MCKQDVINIALTTSKEEMALAYTRNELINMYKELTNSIPMASANKDRIAFLIKHYVYSANRSSALINGYDAYVVHTELVDSFVKVLSRNDDSTILSCVQASVIKQVYSEAHPDEDNNYSVSDMVKLLRSELMCNLVTGTL